MEEEDKKQELRMMVGSGVDENEIRGRIKLKKTKNKKQYNG